MSRARLRTVLFPALGISGLAVTGGLGCAVSLSAIASPTVDTTGHFGTEERLHLTSAAGDPRLRFFVALSGGAGYLDGPKAGFGTIAPELGVEGGREIQWSASALYSPRFLASGPVDVVNGGGVAGQVLFRVADRGGEHASLLLGPRLSAEVLDLNPDPVRTDGARAVGLFQLGLVLRWTTFDTTGNSWTR